MIFVVTISALILLERPSSVVPRKFARYLRRCHSEGAPTACGRSSQAAYPTLRSTSKKLFRASEESMYLILKCIAPTLRSG